MLAVSLVALLASAEAFAPASTRMRSGNAALQMSAPPDSYTNKPKLGLPKNDDKKATGFNYDPSNYKDSANEGNYRRLGDQLAAVKAEEDKLNREREELIRKEKMEAMFLKQENETFWNTPGDQIVASSDKFFVSPSVISVIDDLDNQLIGLQPVKEKMRRYAGQMLSHEIRKAAGIKATIPPLHHVFTGNPGTGKTTVAMKMGELYREMGFINVGHTVQATRADLVGQYIGHTGPKTKEMITRSFGGILFIDEAYGLYKEDSRDYGSEVIEMLVKFMDNTENKDFVVCLAGYRDLMTKMLNANLNLMSRMGNWIDFPDYDDAELLQISELYAGMYSYGYPDDAKATFSAFMQCRKEFPYFSNARTVRNAMERARRIAATRILEDALSNGTKYTMDEIQSFQAQDFQFMLDEIKNLPRETMLP
jgi:probable Rubsico expression protein CbbX